MFGQQLTARRVPYFETRRGVAAWGHLARPLWPLPNLWWLHLQSEAQPREPPEGTLGYCTCAQVAGGAKHRKKCGWSVAYKTIGPFLSQR